VTGAVLGQARAIPVLLPSRLLRVVACPGRGWGGTASVGVWLLEPGLCDFSIENLNCGGLDSVFGIFIFVENRATFSSIQFGFCRSESSFLFGFSRSETSDC
jgi:hypothetical protein